MSTKLTYSETVLCLAFKKK